MSHQTVRIPVTDQSSRVTVQMIDGCIEVTFDTAPSPRLPEASRAIGVPAPVMYPPIVEFLRSVVGDLADPGPHRVSVPDIMEYTRKAKEDVGHPFHSIAVQIMDGSQPPVRMARMITLAVPGWVTPHTKMGSGPHRQHRAYTRQHIVMLERQHRRNLEEYRRG